MNITDFDEMRHCSLKKKNIQCFAKHLRFKLYMNKILLLQQRQNFCNYL